MAELITGLDAGRVRANLERVRADIEAAARVAGRDPAGVEICAATKYVAPEEMGVLAAAGIGLAGENRAQDLEAKQALHGDDFIWDFIGHLQSRKVKQLLPRVRLIHSVSSASAIDQLGRHAAPGAEVLIEVNVAGEASKSGVEPAALAETIARCPVRVGGLMTLPPPAADPEESRPHFAAVRELAAQHDLERLSMGTSQDYVVAVQEGATIVRIGASLYR